MTQFHQQLSIGSEVLLTQEGAKEHREWHTIETTITYIAVGAAVLPVAIPGAIGVAIGGTALGIGTIGQAAAGAAAGAAAANFTESTTQEAMTYGLIINKQQRWWGQEGYDYEVEWPDGTTSWHLSKHLTSRVM